MESKPFWSLVNDDVRQHGLITSGQQVLAAVSGGKDSVALLLALLQIPGLGPAKVKAAHYNHGIREDSGEDEAFVVELCRKWGVEIATGRPRELRGRVSEEEARRGRWAFLQESADLAGAELIATGHTLEDRAETVLLNIVRGAGINGLAAMGWRNGRIIRPLLGRTRAEVISFLEEQAQTWREDSTNASLSYARNRMRHQVLPLLEAEFNPQVKAALVRLAETAAMDVCYLDKAADDTLREALVPDPLEQWGIPGASISLDAGRLAAAHPAVRARALQGAVRKLRDSSVDVEADMIRRLLGAVASEGPGAGSIGLGIQYRLTAQSLRLYSRLPEALPFQRELQPGDEAVLGSYRAGLSLVEPEAKWKQRVPAVAGSVTIRSWRPGDRMQPIGLNGTKKLQDIFVDAHVPREVRSRLPIFVLGDHVVWVPGLAASEECRQAAGPWLWVSPEPTNDEYQNQDEQ